MKLEINGTKVLGILGAALSIGATIASNMASEKKQAEVIEKKVSEVLASKNQQ